MDRRTIADLMLAYPGASAWPFGDSPALADELAELVARGMKTASCGSLSAFQAEDDAPRIGSYCIILNGGGKPVCVIRMIAMRLIRYCDVGEEFARKEGEGDLSLRYWRQVHKEYFQRAGAFDEAMELVAEEFELVEIV